MNQPSKIFDPVAGGPDRRNFGRAVDEIRLKRNIEKLTSLMDSLDRSQRPNYLADEIASQRRILEQLRLERNR